VRLRGFVWPVSTFIVLAIAGVTPGWLLICTAAVGTARFFAPSVMPFVFVAGAGGVGSNTIVELSRRGFWTIGGDKDRVEGRNLETTPYLKSHIGGWKVDALRSIAPRYWGLVTDFAKISPLVYACWMLIPVRAVVVAIDDADARKHFADCAYQAGFLVVEAGMHPDGGMHGTFALAGATPCIPCTLMQRHARGGHRHANTLSRQTNESCAAAVVSILTSLLSGSAGARVAAHLAQFHTNRWVAQANGTSAWESPLLSQRSCNVCRFPGRTQIAQGTVGYGRR
jgi:hypothetical protein